MKTKQELTNWWEEELTMEQRSKLMGDYMWEGTEEERESKLLEMYKKWK